MERFDYEIPTSAKPAPVGFPKDTMVDFTESEIRQVMLYVGEALINYANRDEPLPDHVLRYIETLSRDMMEAVTGRLPDYRAVAYKELPRRSVKVEVTRD
jgi:hypothetical protein